MISCLFIYFSVPLWRKMQWEAPNFMQYLVFDNMDECSEKAVETLLPLVSSQRKEQALKFRHVFGQFACLKSYVLLSELMNWTHEEATQMSFCYNEFGQPMLPESYRKRYIMPYFSISHCKHAIAVAVSESPVGVDVESIRTVNNDLVNHTMNEWEQVYIHQAANPASAFTELWTRKESLLKFRGTGINGDLIHVLDCIPEKIEQKVEKNNSYVMTITTMKPFSK